MGLEYAQDHIVSVFEGYLSIPFTVGVWHDYRVVSACMREYDLYVDNQLTRHGAFVHASFHAHVAWGDGVQGAASLHRWDFIRFETVRLGDVNQDGSVTFDDIDPFIEALTLEEDEFQAQHPGWFWRAADCDNDGDVDLDDINSFVAFLGEGAW